VSFLFAEERLLVARLWFRRLVGLFVFLILLYGLSVVLRIWYLSNAVPTQQSTAIVVMGGPLQKNAVTPDYQARLDTAAKYYKQGLAPRILTLGDGSPSTGVSRASVGRDYLIDKAGVPARAVTMEATGADTLSSLQAASTVLRANGWASIILVTDPYGEFRASKMAQNLGLLVEAAPPPKQPVYQGTWHAIGGIARETFAYLVYVVLHISTRISDPSTAT
jgi:uncharacterized SAM-binding protein YcdF (DUF218 family)